MIETFFAADTLNSTTAWLLAAIIGFFFGVALEQAGFGSSRKLAGIFYFRDMTVLKVMFSAVIIAMIGIAYLSTFGFISSDNVFFLPTYYVAQLVGGLIFGVGFVMGGWCPGTAAVGLASGRIDALVFLGGAMGGSILYNESYSLFAGLSGESSSGLLFIWESLGISQALFVLLFTIVGLAAFWGSEFVEKKVSGTGIFWRTPFLKGFTVLLIVAALPLFLFGSPKTEAGITSTAISAEEVEEQQFLQSIENEEDHISPTGLADLLVNGSNITLVDVRPLAEYQNFHIKGAIHAPLDTLLSRLKSLQSSSIILYSNGMTHPAQARDVLLRSGYSNVRILTDGLTGFLQQCLKPVSLRSEPVTETERQKVEIWRNWFLTPTKKEGKIIPVTNQTTTKQAMVTPKWLKENLDSPNLKIIDVRAQPLWNGAHIPGSLRLDVESLRGVVGGIPSMLLPASLLAAHASLMGIHEEDQLIIVEDGRIRDATLVWLAFKRLGHQNIAILSGGYPAWVAEDYPVTSELPVVIPSEYKSSLTHDSFTITGEEISKLAGQTLLLDTRPAINFTGKESDESRAGHIPGSVNRCYDMDVIQENQVTSFLPLEQLKSVYSTLIPSIDHPVIVSCRTGHQASQTLFLLQEILGYSNVKWYDGGWTEWSANLNYPIEI